MNFHEVYGKEYLPDSNVTFKNIAVNDILSLENVKIICLISAFDCQSIKIKGTYFL
jgi:hypothetical protein